MNISLGYGKGNQSVLIPDENVIGILSPNEIEVLSRGTEEVKRALMSPICTKRLKDIVKPGERIAIVTSDITRPCPTAVMLPPVLDELKEAGVSLSDVSVTFALGSHRGHTEEEKKKLLGSAYGTILARDSDPDNCVNLGDTSMGTPINIDAFVAGADRRILLGNIEFHYFAGYSGGAKALMPGVSNRPAIQSNHSHMINENSYAGRIEGNPVREELEEAAAVVGANFILNVVLDEHKEIVHASAGHMILAHREGCRFLDSMYKKMIPERADIVIVSQGGAPKDLNLYQVQKALDNAKHAVKKGGIIILVGACNEGLGEKTFKEWMLWADKPEDLIQRISSDFRLGGHKAAAIAMVLSNADIYLVSEMDSGLVESIFMKPFSSVQEALDSAFRKINNKATVMIMPWGGSTLPFVSTENK